MIKCGRTGATLLYGTKCVGCDCQLARFADGGFVRDPGTVHVMGFDLASGPDKIAHIRGQRVSDRYEYRVEDIEAATHPDLDRLMRENEARLRAMREAAFGRAMYGDAWTTDPPWHFNCRSTMRETAYEIITDSADRRGFDAKPIGSSR